MTSTQEGSGMSRQQGDESRRFSAVRGASEWVVRGYKGFDIFCGRPIQWQEWPNIDLYLQFVTMVLQMKGPFSDRTPAPAGGNSFDACPRFFLVPMCTCIHVYTLRSVYMCVHGTPGSWGMM